MAFLAAPLMITAAVLLVWATVAEPHMTLKMRRAKIPLKIWNEKLDGLKIAVIGNIHAGKGPHERRRT